MKPSKKIGVIIGTRPEVIKMAPVIKVLKKNGHDVKVINTGQHKELLNQMLNIFELHIDIDLAVMRDNQTLALLSSNLFIAFDKIFTEVSFDFIFVQGDTTTALVASEVAFYKMIPIGHVEAGLRSFDFREPFPEEMNRVFISKLASLHFAPTEGEKNNLLKEGTPPKQIFVTGNTVIDALLETSHKNIELPLNLTPNKKMILATVHRRENFGKPLEDIFTAFKTLVHELNNIEIVYPVHPNPNVKSRAYEMLSQEKSIHLIEPVPYDILVALLKKSYLVVTDSGGLQEEAPALDKPVLVLRNKTERPLIIQLGMGRLVGTECNSIVNAVKGLVVDKLQYTAMQKGYSPYGDGHAADEIAIIMKEFFKRE